MKVNVELPNAYQEPYAIIYTHQVTDEIQRIIEILGENKTPITAL